MSDATVRVGSRASYRGKRVVVIAAAPFLAERQWMVRWPLAGEGWGSDVALESMLGGVENPSWEVGASVLVGWAPYRRRGEVEAVSVNGDRTVYAVRLPAEERETKEGVRWLRDSHLVRVGPEEIET